MTYMQQYIESSRRSGKKAYMEKLWAKREHKVGNVGAKVSVDNVELTEDIDFIEVTNQLLSPKEHNQTPQGGRDLHIWDNL